MSEDVSRVRIGDKELQARAEKQLKTVIDPELGIDIVNLGLVYEINLFEDGLCEVRVTLTTMGCPFGDVIEGDIKRALKEISEIKESQVKFIWYPAWNPSQMTRYARIALGMN